MSAGIKRVRLKEPPHFEYLAWQFLPKKSIPAWVAHAFHDLGSGRLEALQENRIVTALVGDWIFNGGKGALVLMKRDDFNAAAEVVGDAPEPRYEHSCTDGNGHRMILGYSSEPQGSFAEAVRRHPTWQDHRSIDTRPEEKK